jgi:hypothetical protein
MRLFWNIPILWLSQLRSSEIGEESFEWLLTSQGKALKHWSSLSVVDSESMGVTHGLICQSKNIDYKQEDNI